MNSYKLHPSKIVYDWKTVLESLASRGKPPPSIRVLDTVVFDSENKLRPIKWFYTNSYGLVEVRSVRHLAQASIINSFLKSMQGGGVVFIYCENKRYVVDADALSEITTSFCMGFDATKSLRLRIFELRPKSTLFIA